MKESILLWITLSLLTLCGCVRTSEPISIKDEPSMLQTSSEQLESVYQIPVETDTAITESFTCPLLDIVPGSYLETFIDSNTLDYLDYYLFIPENATENMPLIVFLHGDGEIGRPEILEDFGFIKAAREVYENSFPFISISPCTRTTSWINGNIPYTLKALIDETAERFATDPDHIIITGHSRGSIGTWYMISEYGDYFSAAVPVSCGPNSVLNIENCVKVPVRAVSGNSGEDENIYQAVMQNTVISLREQNADIEMIVLNNKTHGQTSSAAYNEEMIEWMITQ